MWNNLKKTNKIPVSPCQYDYNSISLSTYPRRKASLNFKFRKTGIKFRHINLNMLSPRKWLLPSTQTLQGAPTRTTTIGQFPVCFPGNKASTSCGKVKKMYQKTNQPRRKKSTKQISVHMTAKKCPVNHKHPPFVANLSQSARPCSAGGGVGQGRLSYCSKLQLHCTGNAVHLVQAGQSLTQYW